MQVFHLRFVARTFASLNLLPVLVLTAGIFQHNFGVREVIREDEGVEADGGGSLGPTHVV